MSADKPYYYWDPIGNDPGDPSKPEYVGLRARSYKYTESTGWGFPPDGLGDEAWRMGLYVACHPEDDLAVISLYYLLDHRLRYFGEQPPRMVPWWKRLRRYPHPRRMFTRDPIITGLFGLALAGKIDLINELRFPWKISFWHHLTPAVWAWIRFLKTGKGKYARMFHLATFISYAIGNKLNTIPMYARSLASFMLFICPSEACSVAVMERVPKENLLLHFLNDYDVPYLLMSKPGEYISRKGWQWNGSFTGDPPPPIPEDEFIFLDKEILLKIAEIWKNKKIAENPMNLLSILLNRGSGKSIRN